MDDMNAEVSKEDIKLSRKEEEKNTNKKEQIKNEVQGEEENMKDQVKRKEQKERRERMVDVINKEFGTFIDGKKADLATIDQNILKVRQLLQLVRYGAVKQYYSAVQPKQTGSNPEAVSIHPATKSLLHGKRPRENEDEDPSSLPSVSVQPSALPRSTAPSSSSLPSQSAPSHPDSAPLVKEEEGEGPLPCYMPPQKKYDPFEVLPPRALQHKTKRRIVVGNVSRWIPEDQREGEATHKWMVYVRGDQENPDLAEVDRVVFTLHPSYQPHHQVDISEPPFHLTRRGWGEFPLKVRIVFKNPEDKPVEVVHNLKLDKTFTGLQTLGKETLVDVFLYKPYAGS